MTKREKYESLNRKRAMCGGCTENFYNGNNPHGIQECWNLKSAKIVMKKIVHLSQVPPWKQAPVKTLSCHRKEGYVTVGPKQEY